MAKISQSLADPEEFIPDTGEYYQVAATKAKITPHSAVALLFRYCGSLPHDEYFQHQPTFDLDNCSLRLPSCVPIEEKTIALSYPYPSNNTAKRQALCFLACKRLHQFGGTSIFCKWF
jgi:hypothetical protein